MDVQSIFNAGGVVIKNPNYSKSKKNSQPEYITVADVNNPAFNPSKNGFTNMIYNAALENKGVLGESKDLRKYEEYGLTPNSWENLDGQLADAQSNWAKAWHATTQTLVSEIGLGTLRGIADLTDFLIGGAIRQAKGEENDYTNPVSEKIQEWQKAFEEYQPIYATPGVNILHGGLMDFGWWMSNMPSVASSLTLLIPSTGFAKGVSWLGKATRFNKGVGATRRFLTAIDKVDKAMDAGEELGRLSRFSRWINNENTVRKFNQGVEMTLNGFTSRVMENYQEANQVYQDLLPEIYNGNPNTGVKGIKDMSDSEYQAFVDRNADVLENVDTNDRNAVANRIAKASADRTFYSDMVNGFFDVYELYALRNLTRFKNAPMRAAVRRKHLDSIKYMNKTADEIKALKAARSWGEKVTERAGDLLYGSKVAFTAQLNEGVEEAVNYIAQQEGMHYGHILMNGDDGTEFWRDRLAEYAKAPELYDAAFWGLMGGIMFQAGGSYMARAKHAYDVKQANKKYQEDEKTKEKVEKVSWSQAFEDPEMTARINNIENRQIETNNLFTALDQINRGINPFEKDEQGNNKTLNTEEEKEIARDKAYNKRATDLLLSSMFCGNWDITRAYLESDEIRDGITEVIIQNEEKRVQEEENRSLTEVEKSAIKEKQLKRQEQVAKLADKIENLYSQNLRAIGNAMRGKDEATGTKYSNIPTEYFQIIAEENVRHQLDAEQFEENIKKYEPIINSEEARIKTELEENGIDYKEAIRSFILAQQLGQLEAEIAAAKESKKDNKNDKAHDLRTIQGQTALRELELRKKVLTNMLRESSQSPYWNDQVDAKLLVTLRAAAATETDGKGGYRMNMNSQRYKDIDAAILKANNAETDEEWNEAKQALIAINPEFEKYNKERFKYAAHLADVFEENISRALGADGAIETLDNLSHSLLTSYATVTYNEIAKNLELSHIAKDKDSIRLLDNNKHNIMNAMRHMIAESALYSLKSIYKQHSDIAGLENALAYGTLNKQSRDSLKEILSKDEMKTYDDAMKILSLINKNVVELNDKEKDKIKQVSAINSLLPEIVKDALYQSYIDEFEEVTEDEVVGVSEEIKETEESEEEKTTQTNAQTTTTNTNTSQSSSAPQNSSQSIQNLQPTTTSQTQPKRKRSQKKKAKIDFHIAKSGNRMENQYATISVNDEGNPIKLNIWEPNTSEYTDTALIPVEGENNTYELDFKTEISSDSKDTSDEVFTNPYFFDVKTPMIADGVIIDNPRVVIDDEGNILETRPGIIDNPNRAGSQEEQTANEESHSSTGDEESTSNTGGTKAAAETVANPIPVEEFNDENAGGLSNEDSVSKEEYDSDNLNTDITQRMALYIKECKLNNKPYNETELYNRLKEEFKDKVNEEDLDNAFNVMKTFGRKMAERYDVATEELVDIIDFVDASSIYDSAVEDEKTIAYNNLQDAFNKVIEDYLKRAVVDEKSGRKVISLENLLRYTIQVTGSNHIGQALYDRFLEQLQGHEDYILLSSENNKNKNVIIQNAIKTSEERLNEIVTSSGNTIDVKAVSDKLSKDKKEKLHKILDNLKIDDEISFEVVNDGRGISFKKNNVEIARIPVPKETDTNYITNNNGWICDIPKSNDGSIGKLESLFIRIMTNPNNEEEIKPIIAAIQEAMYTKTKVKNTEGKEITNPKYEEKCIAIINAIKDAGINIDEYLDLNTKSEANAGAYVVNIYRGVKQASEQWLSNYKIGTEEYQQSINARRAKSIHNWFEKLKSSHQNAIALASNPNLKIKVDKVREGGLRITSQEEALPVNDENSIGSNYKDTLQIVVASNSEPGKLYSTDGNTRQMSSVNVGSTFVSITRKDGTVELIHAFPQPIGASTLSDELKTIHNEVLDEFERLITAWGTNPHMSVNDIANFIETLCSSKNQNNPLFRGLKVTRLTNGFEGIQIQYKQDGKTKYIKLFDANKSGKVSVIKIGTNKATYLLNKSDRTPVIKELRNILSEALTYNVEFDYVRGKKYLKGFATRKPNGHFIIQIPNGKTHEFNSYKEFVIENGVVNVTTETKDGKTNFYRENEGKTQFDRPIITYKVIDSKTTPVEESKTSTSKENVVEIPHKGDSIKSIIENNDNGVDVGQQILNEILTDTQLNILKNSSLIKEIPFGNIIFVDEFENDIAGYIKRQRKINGKIIPADTIIVTQAWIDLLNSYDTSRHEEAVRHLIHEGIHKRIKTLSKDDKKQLFTSIRTIFNEFVAANEKDGIRDKFNVYEYNTTEKDIDKFYKNGELNDKGLEEFLVESITRPALINRLNSIAADGGKITKTKVGNIKSKNLFQKILATIAKLFNLNINKGSLLEKEYKLFLRLGTLENNITQETNNKTSNAQQLEFNFDDNNQQENKQEFSENSVTKVDDVNIASAMLIEVDDDDIDASRIYDNATEIASLSQIRDTIIPENRRNFENLVSEGAIEINC